MRAAQSIYAACLWLYPKQLRDAHGDEMRQGFRDRCREAVRGERSAFRVVALELMPDMLLSAGNEQLSATFGEMRPRQYWALGLLCCASIGLLFQDTLNRHTLDLAFQTKYWVRNEIQEYQQVEREKQLRRLAEHLVASNTNESRALAAYLYRSLYTGRNNLYLYGEDRGGSPFIADLPADGRRATALARRVFRDRLDVYALAVAVQACTAATGCDQAGTIKRLTDAQPDNGFGWALAFKWASLHDNPSAMRYALGRLGQSHYFESYEGPIARDLIAGAESLAPDDIDLLATVAGSISAKNNTIDDFKHDVRVQCRPRQSGDSAYNSTWLEVNPASRGDCLRVAELMTGSSELFNVRWGWRRLYAQARSPVLRAQAYQHLRDVQWWRQSALNSGFGYIFYGIDDDSHSIDWKGWRAARKDGDGEIPAIKRWLASRGLPTSAPPGFELPADYLPPVEANP